MDPVFSGSYSKPLRFTPKRSTGDGQPWGRRWWVPRRGFGGVTWKVEGLGDKNIFLFGKDDGVIK